MGRSRLLSVLTNSLGLSVEDVGETGAASGEKNDILDSLSTEGALDVSQVIDLSLSFGDFFNAGSDISVTLSSGESEKGEGHEPIVNVEVYCYLPAVFAFFSLFGVV